MLKSENASSEEPVNVPENEWSIEKVLISYVKWIAAFLSIFGLYFGLEFLIFGTEGRRTAYEDILEQSIILTLLLWTAASIPKSKSCFTVVAKIGALPLLLIFIWKGWEISRVDAHLAELCKKDGGTKIYERVVLPKDQFTKYGDPAFHQGWNKSSDGYQFIFKYDELKENNPMLLRLAYSIVRESDQKVLGTHVVYVRKGGGIMWRPGPDPSKSCPPNANEVLFVRSIFLNPQEKGLP